MFYVDRRVIFLIKINDLNWCVSLLFFFVCCFGGGEKSLFGERISVSDRLHFHSQREAL